MQTHPGHILLQSTEIYPKMRLSSFAVKFDTDVFM